MTSLFYLHDAASGVAGTLPATNAAVSAQTPGAGTTISLVNKSMNGTVGVAQASIAKTTLANTANQQVPYGRWISLPIAAQTIAQQNISIDLAGSESSTNSDFFARWCIAVWRPSTGAVVGRVADFVTAAMSFDFTTQTASTATDLLASTTAVVCLDGDVVIFEVWRDSTVQAMATAYTNTLFYDGTTPGSGTSEAAFIQFTNDVALSTGAAVPGFVHRRGPNYRR